MFGKFNHSHNPKTNSHNKSTPRGTTLAAASTSTPLSLVITKDKQASILRFQPNSYEMKPTSPLFSQIVHQTDLLVSNYWDQPNHRIIPPKPNGSEQQELNQFEKTAYSNPVSGLEGYNRGVHWALTKKKPNKIIGKVNLKKKTHTHTQQKDVYYY